MPQDYPQLRRLAWNQGPARPNTGAEAFGLYEAHWRHVDAGSLDAGEAALIRALAERHGAATCW